MRETRKMSREDCGRRYGDDIQEVRYIKAGGPLSGHTFGFDVDGKTFPTYAEAKGHADRLLLSKHKTPRQA